VCNVHYDNYHAEFIDVPDDIDQVEADDETDSVSDEEASAGDDGDNYYESESDSDDSVVPVTLYEVLNAALAPEW